MTSESYWQPYVLDADGQTTRPLLSPNKWRGNSSCLVGPFSSLEAAEVFITAKRQLYRFDTFQKHVFVRGDSWYVQVDHKGKWFY